MQLNVIFLFHQLAVVFEALGAYVLGRTITGTIQGGIADINAYVREPEVNSLTLVKGADQS